MAEQRPNYHTGEKEKRERALRICEEFSMRIFHQEKMWYSSTAEEYKMGLVELSHTKKEEKEQIFHSRAAKRENEGKNMCAGESSLFLWMNFDLNVLRFSFTYRSHCRGANSLFGLLPLSLDTGAQGEVYSRKAWNKHTKIHSHFSLFLYVFFSFTRDIPVQNETHFILNIKKRTIQL